jgi:protein-tyrosine phosphatase
MKENPCDRILDHLYVGTEEALNSKIKFDMLVNCTVHLEFPRYTKLNSNIRIPIEDSPYNCDNFIPFIKHSKVLDKIRQKLLDHHNVLVYCSDGGQRSCSLMACYIMKYLRISPTHAMSFIKTRRPSAYRGDHYLLSSIEYFYIELCANKNHKI